MKSRPIPGKIEYEMKKYPSFYQRVWKVCAQIPKGEVRSYKWVAQKVGSPHSSRAVGNALKMNPFSPTIPCHRVVRSDGGLGGYSAQGGPHKKRALLSQEGAWEN